MPSIFPLFAYLIWLLPICSSWQWSHRLQGPAETSRRSLFEQASVVLTSSLVASSFPCPGTASASENMNFRAFKVLPDDSASLSPEIEAIKSGKFIKSICNKSGGAIWLGEHHNSASDHNLQVEILRGVHEMRRASGAKTAIGLEQVQLKFQPFLDDYVANKISLADMREGVEWDTRWMWPFEVYQPIFETAKELQMPLVALNVNSEDLALVEKGGFPNLPKDRTRVYISDPVGFAEFAKPRAYSTYVNYVIRPSYELHEEMGLLRYTMNGEKLDQPMSFRTFFSGRILWDESMANTAHAWTKQNPGGLLVGLVGADHVKFRNGIPGRYARLASDDRECVSVMLNPTLIDTRPSGSVAMGDGSDSNRPDNITLQLRYLKDGVDIDSDERLLPSATGGVLAISDYIVIS